MSDAHLDRFRRLSMLLLVIERLAASPRVRALSFHDEQERQVGSVRLDAGMVEIGAELQGRPYTDDAFLRDGAPVAATLQKLLHGQSLSVSEGLQLHRIPLIARRCLCGVTARALRRISQLCDLNKIRIVDQAPAKEPRASAEGYTFSPVELLLAAGRQGDVRYSDVAARMYEEPPGTAEERWLFEWQPDDSDGPWPIMTTRMAERKTSTVAQFGLLGQSMTHHLARQRRAPDSSLPAATLASTDLHSYYSVTSERYVALFVYSIRQQDRLLKSLEGLIYLPKSAASQIANLNSSRRSPSIQVADPPRQSPIQDLPVLVAPVPAASAARGSGVHSPSSDSDKPAVGSVSTPAAAAARRDEASEWLSAVELAVTDTPQDAPPSASASASETVAASSNASPSPTVAASSNASPSPAVLLPAVTSLVQSSEPTQQTSQSASASLVVPTATTAATVAAPAVAQTSEPSRGGVSRAEHPSSPPALVEPAPAGSPDSGPVTVKGQPDARPKPAAGGVSAEASSAVTLPEAVAANADEEDGDDKPLLVAQRFSASFDGRTLLQDFDLSLARRGVYALIAPTREACSALFGILSGRHREANGWTFDGDLRFNNAALGQSVRPVVLGPQITPSRLSIRSYLLQDLPSEASADFPRARLLNLLMEVGLGHLARQPDAPLDSPTLPLSTGEWWLLAIARELIRDPKLICLDEPMEGLSPAHSAALTRLLRQQGERRTILLSTRSESDASACHAKSLFLPGNASTQLTPTVDRALDGPPDESAAAQRHEESTQASVPAAGFAAAPSPVEAMQSRPEESRGDPPAAFATSPAPSDPERARRHALPLLKLSALSVQLHKLLLLPTTSVEITATGLYLIQCQRATARKALIRVLCGEPLPQLQISGCALWQGSDLLTQQGDRPITPPRQAHWLLLTGREYLQDAIHGPQRSQEGAALPTLMQFLELAGASNLLQRLDVALCDLPAHERRQLELLRCIRLAPKLMVLDDPLMGTGPDEKMRLLHLLRTAAKCSAVLVVVRSVGLYCDEQGNRPTQIFYCDDDDLPAEDASRTAILAPTSRPSSATAAPAPPLHPSSVLPISDGQKEGKRRGSVTEPSDSPANLSKRVTHASV